MRYRRADEGESQLPRPPRTETRPTAPNWNRITVWEVVGYTAAILFIGALALGWFDIMLPWTKQ